MIDNWLLVVILIVGTVVAIEGMPDGFDKKAKTFVTELAVAVMGIIKRAASIVMFAVTRIRHQVRQSRTLPHESIERPKPVLSLRVVTGTAVAVVSSPIAGIPMTFLFALSLYALNLIGGDEYSFATDGPGTLRYILGYAFVILVAALDVTSRWFAITFPVLVLLGFIAAYHASRSKRFVRNLALSTLLIGGVYPLIFMLASALNVYHGPIFN